MSTVTWILMMEDGLWYKETGKTVAWALIITLKLDLAALQKSSGMD